MAGSLVQLKCEAQRGSEAKVLAFAVKFPAPPDRCNSQFVPAEFKVWSRSLAAAIQYLKAVSIAVVVSLLCSSSQVTS